jgi:glycosyltransferase involved in cell wall biosynthesis
LNTGRTKASFLKVGEIWRQKAYHAIPLSGLIPVSQTTTELTPKESIRWTPDVQIGARSKNALYMHPSCSVSYRLYIPARAKFSSYIALTSDVLEKNRHGVVFRVEVFDGDAKVKIKRTKLIHPKNFHRHGKWNKFKLGLHRLANREVQIVLSISIVDHKDPSQALAIWGDPTVLFRASFVNLIDLARNKLRAHGFVGTFKKTIGVPAGASLSKGNPELGTTFSETIFEKTRRDRYLTELFARSSGPSSDYFPIMKEDVEVTEPQVKLIAFYLPQFHPIPENDEWWGKGFTEWTHVARAIPQFLGHYQPRLPGELGFYDLRVLDVQRRQVELAKKYGISGFCFHYYWFSGKRLLDLPLKQFLDSTSLDFPFCLCWANENWTRRWDGLDNEVLIAQTHSPQDDLAFIESVEPMLRDKRYIRVSGRPLLIVYRPSLLPDPRQTAQRWRDYMAKSECGGLYLVAVQAFETVDPRLLGFDAAVEFPPHKLAEGAPVLNQQMEIVNPDYQGVISDYSYMVESAKKIHRSDFTLFRGVSPSWDNDARKPGRGITYQNSTPALYQEWLAQACRYTAKEPDPDKRLVFINAWNEWSEGAYLEPDRRYGYAYLQATVNALERFANPQVQRGLPVVFVSHDAANAGAQRLLITLIEWLRDTNGVQPRIVLRHGGPLVPEFYRLGPVFEMDSHWRSEEVKAELIRFCGNSPALIFINTLVPGDVAKKLSELKVPILTHVHEMENAIKRWCVKEDLEQLIELTDHFIAASPPVAKNLENVHHVLPERITTVYEFIKCQKKNSDSHGRIAVRRQKQLPKDGFIIFGCGTTDWRKGPDLFIEVADHSKTLGLENAYFLWIGVDTGEVQELEAKVRRLGLEDRVRFLGEAQDARNYFAAGDLFLLTSREDPFPLVCLEAADCGLPIICFDKAGGMPDFVQDDAGYVVPFEDTKAMTEKLIVLCVNREERVRRGAVACQRVRARHDISVGGQEIFQIIDKFAVAPG